MNVPRSRQAAQEQAELLVQQIRLGWGPDHEFTRTIATLAGRIIAENKVVELKKNL